MQQVTDLWNRTSLTRKIIVGSLLIAIGFVLMCFTLIIFAIVSDQIGGRGNEISTVFRVLALLAFLGSIDLMLPSVLIGGFRIFQSRRKVSFHIESKTQRDEVKSLADEKRAFIAQISPMIVEELSEFASKKWPTGYRIYYISYDDKDYVHWLVHSTNGTYLNDAQAYEYPAYYIFLNFDYDSANPLDLTIVHDEGGRGYVTTEIERTAFRNGLLEVLTNNYTPGTERSWNLEPVEGIDEYIWRIK